MQIGKAWLSQTKLIKKKWHHAIHPIISKAKSFQCEGNPWPPYPVKRPENHAKATKAKTPKDFNPVRVLEFDKSYQVQGPIDFWTNLWQAMRSNVTKKHLRKKQSHAVPYPAFDHWIMYCQSTNYTKNAPWISTSLWASSLVPALGFLFSMSRLWLCSSLFIIRTPHRKSTTTGTPEHQSRNTL